MGLWSRFSPNMCWGSVFLLTVAMFVVIVGLSLFGHPWENGRYIWIVHSSPRSLQIGIHLKKKTRPKEEANVQQVTWLVHSHTQKTKMHPAFRPGITLVQVWWWFGKVVVICWWCLDDVFMIWGSCFDRGLVMCWWCFRVAFNIFLCCMDVLVMFWACLNDVFVMCFGCCWNVLVVF